MNRKLLITRYQGKILTAVSENDSIVEFHVAEQDSILGNIYVAQVQNVVKNIQAAFLKFREGQTGYYSLTDNKKPLFTNQKQNAKVCVGDSIIVQVERENVKTKPPTLTSKINLTGKYVVLTVGNTRLSISAKITDRGWRQECSEHFSRYCNTTYGFIIRTNAFGVKLDIIEKEIQNLVASFEKICDDGIHRVCYSCLHQNPPEFITQVKNIYQDGLEAVLTDDTEVYEALSAYMKAEQPEDREKLRYYEDSWSLSSCYNIEKQLERALNERVWLKSGAYLVIQPTEALTVIDVNTGKYIGNKTQPDTMLKINLEAAKEIARQLRLRNMSGMILVDFMNMSRGEDQKKLLEELELLIRKDAVKTVLYGMTNLGLVEITRKKIKKPLQEQLLTFCPACHGTGRLLKADLQKEDMMEGTQNG